jgi:hypothetical protein
MCPSTSGIGDADVIQSLELGERAAQLALGRSNFSLGPSNPYDDGQNDPGDEAGSSKEAAKPVHKDGGLLVPGGNFVVKLLEGSGTKGGSVTGPFFQGAYARTKEESHFPLLFGRSLKDSASPVPDMDSLAQDLDSRVIVLSGLMLQRESSLVALL